MMKRSLALLLLLLPLAVMARTVTISWTNPTVRCDGAAIDAAELAGIEIYIDTSPIPGPAEGEDTCTTPYDAPAGFTPVAAQASDSSTTTDLEPGATYYFRARVSDTEGQWSSLNQQVEFTVPARLQAPAVLNIQF